VRPPGRLVYPDQSNPPRGTPQGQQHRGAVAAEQGLSDLPAGFAARAGPRTPRHTSSRVRSAVAVLVGAASPSATPHPSRAGSAEPSVTAVPAEVCYIKSPGSFDRSEHSIVRRSRESGGAERPNEPTPVRRLFRVCRGRGISPSRRYNSCIPDQHALAEGQAGGPVAPA
jgi:hypothetical protein